MLILIAAGGIVAGLVALALAVRYRWGTGQRNRCDGGEERRWQQYEEQAMREQERWARPRL